jgi:hypothetical protein
MNQFPVGCFRIGRTPTLLCREHADAVRQVLRINRIRRLLDKAYTVTFGTAFDVAPHIAHFHRLPSKWNIVLLSHDLAHVKRTPTDPDASSGDNIINPHHR